jgi:hypothetical protein
MPGPATQGAGKRRARSSSDSVHVTGYEYDSPPYERLAGLRRTTKVADPATPLAADSR